MLDPSPAKNSTGRRYQGVTRACLGCGQSFAPARKDQIHCRPSCRAATYRTRHPLGRLWDGDDVSLAGLCPLAQDVARYFLAHQGEWVTMQTLAHVAGTGGWRTRVAEVRRQLEPQGYRLANRQGTVETPEGRRRTSAYRLTRGA